MIIQWICVAQRGILRHQQGQRRAQSSVISMHIQLSGHQLTTETNEGSYTAIPLLMTYCFSKRGQKSMMLNVQCDPQGRNVTCLVYTHWDYRSCSTSGWIQSVYLKYNAWVSLSETSLQLMLLFRAASQFVSPLLIVLSRSSTIFYRNVLWYELSFVNTPQLLLQYLSLGGIRFFPCIYYTKNKKKTKETEKIWPNDNRLPHHASFARGLNNTLRHCGYWHMGGLNSDDVWVVIADWKLYKSHMLIKVFSNNFWVWKSRSCQLAHLNFLFFFFNCS